MTVLEYRQVKNTYESEHHGARDVGCQDDDEAANNR